MIHALIADKRTVRVFEASGPAGTPWEIAVLRNQAAGHHERDLVSDRPGRTVNSASRAHQAYEPKRRASEHAMEVWLKEIGPSIRQLLESRGCDGLILVASPRMLGQLRARLPARLRKLVAGEMRVDLIGGGTAALKRRLGPAMAAARRKGRRAYIGSAA